MICCIPQPFFVAACLLPSALSSKKGWTPMTSAFRKTPGVEKPHIETIRNYWHSGSATVKQLALQATLHLFQVLLLEMVHFLRLCAVQNFSLIVGVTSAKKHTTSKMAKDIKTWSKVCHPAAISVDNHKHSQPCQARIPRPSRSSHSCHKIRKYQKSLEYVMGLYGTIVTKTSAERATQLATHSLLRAHVVLNPILRVLWQVQLLPCAAQDFSMTVGTSEKNLEGASQANRATSAKKHTTSKMTKDVNAWSKDIKSMSTSSNLRRQSQALTTMSSQNPEAITLQPLLP